eukprot:55506_1
MSCNTNKKKRKLWKDESSHIAKKAKIENSQSSVNNSNEQKTSDIEYEHFKYVKNIFNTKYLQKTELILCKPYLKLLNCIEFDRRYQFVTIKTFEDKKIALGNFRFFIGSSQNQMLQILNANNTDFKFANKIISEMIGDQSLSFELKCDAIQYLNDEEYKNQWFTDDQRISLCNVFFEGKLLKVRNMVQIPMCVVWTKEHFLQPADKICERMPLLVNYDMDWEKLYEVVDIVIREFCHTVNDADFFLSSLHYGGFFGFHPPCKVKSDDLRRMERICADIVP